MMTWRSFRARVQNNLQFNALVQKEAFPSESHSMADRLIQNIVLIDDEERNLLDYVRISSNLEI